MNKVGIYYAYWTRDWAADFIPFIDKVKSLGFDVLEVNAGSLAEMSNAELGSLKAAAEDAGIYLSACVGLTEDQDLASADLSVRKAGINRLNSIAHAVSAAGIDRVSGIIYSCWPAQLHKRNVTRNQAVDWSVSSMKEAVKAAEDLGITYNLEVVNRFEQFVMNTAEEGVSYIKAVDSANLKLLLDTFHMNIEEDSFAEAIMTAGSLLGHLHMGENNRRPPGAGHLPWQEIMNALKFIKYEGWLVMEPFLKPGGEVGRDISVFREIMPGADIDQEARKSCSYIKSCLQQAQLC